MICIIGLILAIALLLIGIIRFKIHPFFMLLFVAIGYGFFTGMEPSMIIQSINSGFGDILGKIGLLILFGVVLGTVLEKSGGAMVMATFILNAIGEKAIYVASMLTGYLLSIPIFADSALLIINPLNKVLSKQAGVAYAGTTAALCMGLTASHVMVPPTPGPIAAAGILGASLGQVILWGILISLLALFPCYFYARLFTSRIQLPIHIEPIANPKRPPALWKSLLALLIPLALILFKSILEYPDLAVPDSIYKTVFSFLGTPVIALLIGILLSMTLPEKLDDQIFSADGWVGDSFRVAAPIILITGAGGIFGKMLQNSGLADVITDRFEGLELGLFLPFLLAACLKTAQGSSTVSLVATASIISPLLPSLGLDEPFLKALTVLAIGAGASVASHVNDSFFWVLTQLTGMNIKQGYQVQTAGTFIFGCSAMAVIVVIAQIFG